MVRFMSCPDQVILASINLPAAPSSVTFSILIPLQDTRWAVSLDDNLVNMFPRARQGSASGL
jgi:hypothetical protein